MRKTMKAVVFDRYGPADLLKVRSVRKPKPKEGEVLVRIRAATVAKADCEVRSFTFPRWLWLPVRLMFGVFRPRIRILGQELAGDVEAAGAGVADFKPGDRVFAAIEGFGAHAEYICLKADSAIAKIPDGVSYEDAAATTVFALNALHFIRKAALSPGETILINGAGGSIGTHAVQLAKLDGAEATAVDSGDKLDMLRDLGADHAIDYEKQDFTSTGETYDAVLDIAGNLSFRQSMRILKKKSGRLVLANPMLAPLWRGFWANMTGSRRKTFSEFAGYRKEDLVYLGGLLASGRLKAVIDRRFSLDEAIEAHRYIETGRKKGHVVFVID